MLVGEFSGFMEAIEKVLDPSEFCVLRAKPRQVAQRLDRYHPHLVLLNHTPANPSNLHVIRRTTRMHPEVKVLVVDSQADPSRASRVISAGAHGFALQQDDAEEIISAIDDLLAGNLYLSEGLFAATAIPIPTRSTRDRASGRTTEPTGTARTLNFTGKRNRTRKPGSRR